MPSTDAVENYRSVFKHFLLKRTMDLFCEKFQVIELDVRKGLEAESGGYSIAQLRWAVVAWIGGLRNDQLIFRQSRLANAVGN
jgi:hypothetical protein